VKVNTSGSLVNAGNTGRVLGQFQGLSSIDTNTNMQGEQVFPFLDDVPGLIILPDEPSDLLTPQFDATPPFKVGDRMHWTFLNRGRTGYVDRWVRVIYSGKHSNIWVIDEPCAEGQTEFTFDQAKDMADIFDRIYPAVTNILGYEFVPFPRDPKIQIVVYDINFLAIGFGTVGYFDGNDLIINNLSNRQTMFYINTSSFQINRDNTVLTMVHELAHLIYFSHKDRIHNIPRPIQDANLWHNEMIAMMTEDILIDYLGLSGTSTKLRNRIGDFLGNYHSEAMTDWSSTSYGNKWAFGSYLLRNFGGAELLNRMMTNNSVGIDSVNHALNAIYPGMNFEQALIRYGEFMILNNPSFDPGIVSLNREIISTFGNRTYTIPGYDTWSIPRIVNNVLNPAITGPMVFSLDQREIRGHSVLLHTDDSWRNRSGSFSITLERPTNPNIELILMIKEN
jgi:hypothetical protein